MIVRRFAFLLLLGMTLPAAAQELTHCHEVPHEENRGEAEGEQPLLAGVESTFFQMGNGE